MNALSKYSSNKRLNHILEILQKGRMISVTDTASKLNCSSRTINRALQTLKKQGHQFNYSTRFGKFIYSREDDKDNLRNREAEDQ